MPWATIKRKSYRYLTHAASSPVSVFLCILTLVYLCSHVNFNFPNEDVGSNHVDKPFPKKSIKDARSKEHGHVVDITSVAGYQNAVKSLAQVNVAEDPFLQSYARNCVHIDVEEDPFQTVPLCPCVPPVLYGKLPTPVESPSWQEVHSGQDDFIHGGEWKPKHCRARQRVAIIIPYRDREHHLKLLLSHTLNIFKRHLLHFRVILVEQTNYGRFNKALIMNAAFLEIESTWNFSCVIFHDADMLLHDDRSLYACAASPRHLGVYVDKFRYKLIYPELFGGAVAMRRDVFRSVNGYPNTYFGWGGEDDNMYFRLITKGYTIDRYPKDISRYKMVPHSSDKGNPRSEKRMRSVGSMTSLMDVDGLNSISYIVMNITKTNIFTHILVKLGCPLQDKAFMGRSYAPTSTSHTVDLKTCKLNCSHDEACKALSFDMKSNKCNLHTLVKAPFSLPDWLFFQRDCSRVEE